MALGEMVALEIGMYEIELFISGGCLFLITPTILTRSSLSASA